MIHAMQGRLDGAAAYPTSRLRSVQVPLQLGQNARTSAKLLTASLQNCILIFPSITFDTESWTIASSS